MQANAINVSGDVVKRDKITNNITNTITNTITKFFLGGAAEERDRRNRRIMLDKVRAFWVKGVLEQSLHGAALIELGMEYKPDAVQYPWNTVLQRPDHSPQPLPRGAKMIEVFDEEGGELLILGAPGSGKTTMLIDLARDLIARAEQDEMLPIPVVFNLSSWAEKHPPLAEWLIEELSFRYDVPKKVGKEWIEKDQVLPLLDGLDEVKLEQRVACVEAINNFRKGHLIHIAVCSRSSEYEALRTQLRLQTAIVLQPLMHEQIDIYLESAGEYLSSVRALLQCDEALQELAESPLILSIMVLAYRDLDVSSLPILESADEQRKRLFDTYIQRMFERRGTDKCYMPQQVTHWLSWLARQMVDHSQTTFYLERMQPDWLPTHTVTLHTITTGVCIGLFLGLITGVIVGLMDGLVYGPLTGVVHGVVNLLIFGLANGLACGALFGLNKKMKTVPTLRWLWWNAREGWLLGGLALGLVNGPLTWLTTVTGLSGNRFTGPVDQLIFGMVLGAVCGGLIIGLFGNRDKRIEVVETLHWSWQGAIGGQLFRGLFIGLVSGLAVGLISPVLSNPNGLVILALVGLSGGLTGGLIGGLVGGLKISGAIEKKTIPNQGIWRSAQNAILSGLVIGVCVGLFVSPVAGLVFGWVQRVSHGVFFALIFGLLVGLFYGGFVCIQHFTLRRLLYGNGSIPLNYVRFLDYCAERIFLRKVGGGYIFVHRLLMEHFASLETDTTPKPGGKQNSVI